MLLNKILDEMTGDDVESSRTYKSLKEDKLLYCIEIFDNVNSPHYLPF